MSAMAYTDGVVDHFEHPRNAGRFAPGQNVLTGAAGHAREGVHFTLSATIADARIGALRFEAYGCPHCVAAASWLSERLPGATLDELSVWSWREVSQALAVPIEKRGRLLILEDAVRALADSWRRAPYYSARSS